MGPGKLHDTLATASKKGGATEIVLTEVDPDLLHVIFLPRSL